MKCLTNKIAMIVLTLTCTSTVFANTSQPSSQARAEVQVIKMAVGAYADAFGGILSQISDYQREYAAAGFFSRGSVSSKYCQLVEVSVGVNLLMMAASLQQSGAEAREYLNTINAGTGGELNRTFEALTPMGQNVMKACRDPQSLQAHAAAALRNAQRAENLLPNFLNY